MRASARHDGVFSSLDKLGCDIRSRRQRPGLMTNALEPQPGPMQIRRQRLRLGVATVFGQTFQHLEFVVVDNGSTDPLDDALEPFRGGGASDRLTQGTNDPYCRVAVPIRIRPLGHLLVILPTIQEFLCFFNDVIHAGSH